MHNKSISRQYVGAFKRAHRKNVREYIDEEFSWVLLDRANAGCRKSQEALGFLSQFNGEYHKNRVKKGDPNALHKTRAERKACWDRVNAANRDISAIVGNAIKTLDGTNEAGSISLECVQSAKQNMDIESVVVDLIDANRGVSFRKISGF